ncbi:MAG: hypothetical protein J07HQW1_01353 [Haloquadratum walsbyi J07HQW1]|jgi:hypothetical protein|uniref:Uncharacterized protein n=1 Tax=Haloquadratum walsbyi J07HQW1 TaxID=1238424 RepID=U1MNB5_9EURY|nr:MAG: hypothetical protein J07HQW1_01353 [Haloquadratum walsbyi J07HQW1]
MPSAIQMRLSAYFPDRPPTWTEVLIGVLVGVQIVPDILSPFTVSWSAAITGFLAFSVALGPGANSSLGRQIGQWFREIGVTGRVAVIVVFALTTVVVFRFDAVPDALITDAASGGLFAVFLYLIIYILWAGEVSGWKSNRENSD